MTFTRILKRHALLLCSLGVGLAGCGEDTSSSATALSVAPTSTPTTVSSEATDTVATPTSDGPGSTGATGSGVSDPVPPTTTGDSTTGPVVSTGSGATTTSGGETTGGDSTTEDPVFGEIPATCAEAELSSSTVGCRFYAVDMDSYDGPTETNQFAVAVANVQQDQAATVTIERKDGDLWTVIAGPTPVAALDLQSFNLPDQHTNDSQLAAGFAYRVTADVPVIAYQFNPVDGATSFLSDASMLYPTTGLDSINHVIAWPAMNDSAPVFHHSYATAIAVKDDTTITVTPRVATLAGPGVPAGVPNVPFNVVLDEGDVLSVAVQDLGASMTGALFESVKATPFMLFAGHECAEMPIGVCCCDHLEEEISGVRLWGKTFVGARMAIRDTQAPEAALWQIYAAENDTTITLTADPQVTGLPPGPIKLDKGKMVEFYAGGTAAEPGDLLIEADRPIGVMHYMTSAKNVQGENKIGDPAAVQIPSIEQYLPRYVVLVPGTWENDVGVFTRTAGAPVTIDGVPISDAAWFPVAGGDFEVARVPLTDGVHVLDSDGTSFGAYIVGYDTADSYAYLGGIGTKIVNPEPQ